MVCLFNLRKLRLCASPVPEPEYKASAFCLVRNCVAAGVATTELVGKFALKVVAPSVDVPDTLNEFKVNIQQKIKPLMYFLLHH